jgi:hypothetical protein
MKNAGWVVIYTDTRDNITRTLNHSMTGQPFKKQASAEATAGRVRGQHFAADVRVVPVA